MIRILRLLSLMLFLVSALLLTAILYTSPQFIQVAKNESKIR